MSLCPQKAGIRLQRNMGRDGSIATKVQRSINSYAPALVGVGYAWRIHDARWQRDGKSDRLRVLTRTDPPLPGTGATQELGVGECRTLVAATHSSSKSVRNPALQSPLITRSLPCVSSSVPSSPR
jgi:hypothetical protein